jgi:hypothetical protein
MPIRSPRQVYKIPEITNKRANNANEPVIVKMKESIADFLGLTPVPYNDPIWNGTFSGSGSNAGKPYRRRLGGYREASYTLVANTSFRITELIRQADGSYNPVQKNFRTITFGLPAGHSVREVVAFIASKSILAQVNAIVTPAGVRVPIRSNVT